MKITCSKRDDILKRRDEWKNQYDALLSKYHSEQDNYIDAYYGKAQSIVDTVQNMLSEFDALNIRISALPESGNTYYSVNIFVNDDNKFDDDVALSWSYKIDVSDDGEVSKSSGSWSNLKVTTPAQLESLKQSVACIEKIMNTDWSFLLDIPRPKPSDYVQTRPPKDMSRDFDKELLEADIEDMIGTHTIAEYNGPTRYYTNKYGNKVYLGFVSETSKMYKVFEVSSSRLDSITYEDAVDLSYNLRKDTVLNHLVTPLNTEEIQ